MQSLSKGIILCASVQIACTQDRREKNTHTQTKIWDYVCAIVNKLQAIYLVNKSHKRWNLWVCECVCATHFSVHSRWTFVSINCHFFLIWLGDHHNRFVCVCACFLSLHLYVVYCLCGVPFCSSRSIKAIYFYAQKYWSI